MAPLAENYHFGAKNAYYSIVSHCIVWYCMELNFILWYCIVSYCIAFVLHGIAWYCIVLCGIALYRIKSYGIALYHCWLRRAGCISQDTYLLYFRQKYLKIASCSVLLLNNFWVRVKHSLLQQLNFQKK